MTEEIWKIENTVSMAYTLDATGLFKNNKLFDLSDLFIAYYKQVKNDLPNDNILLHIFQYVIETGHTHTKNDAFSVSSTIEHVAIMLQMDDEKDENYFDFYTFIYENFNVYAFVIEEWGKIRNYIPYKPFHWEIIEVIDQFNSFSPDIKLMCVIDNDEEEE